MPKICDFCGKGYQRSKKVPRGIGNRVTRRTLVRREVNLRSKRMLIGGTSIKTKICSSCLKRLKFEANAVKKSEVAAA